MVDVDAKCADVKKPRRALGPAGSNGGLVVGRLQVQCDPSRRLVGFGGFPPSTDQRGQLVHLVRERLHILAVSQTENVVFREERGVILVLVLWLRTVRLGWILPSKLQAVLPRLRILRGGERERSF